MCGNKSKNYINRLQLVDNAKTTIFIMKTTYKNLASIALGALVSVFFALSANAQHRGAGGGGGGGSSSPSGGGRSSGGGGSVSSGSSFHAPSSSPSSVGVSRGIPSSAPRPTVQVQGARPSFNGGTRVGVVRGNYGYPPRTSTAVRGNYGYAPRTYDASHRPAIGGSGSVTAYRSAPRVGWGNGGYWGTHNYYHYNHGYYGSYYLPRIGFSIGVLPFGYYPFYYGDYQYYYSDGLFYQYDNNEYTVVEPPVGAEVKSLPDKAQSIVINGQQYYELNGVYYQPVTKDDGTVVYQVAGKDGELNTDGGGDDQYQGPQMGDVVAQLPPDCRKINVNGEKLWVSPDGVYYQEQIDAQGNKSYKVVGLPSDEQDQQ